VPATPIKLAGAPTFGLEGPVIDAAELAGSEKATAMASVTIKVFCFTMNMTFSLCAGWVWLHRPRPGRWFPGNFSVSLSLPSYFRNAFPAAPSACNTYCAPTDIPKGG
jgi:hypothetical protein